MTKSSRSRVGKKFPAPQVTSNFDTYNPGFPKGGPYATRLSLGRNPKGGHVVELVVGGFEDEAAATKWATALQALIERYAGGKTSAPKGSLN